MAAASALTVCPIAARRSLSISHLTHVLIRTGRLPQRIKRPSTSPHRRSVVYAENLYDQPNGHGELTRLRQSAAGRPPGSLSRTNAPHQVRTELTEWIIDRTSGGDYAEIHAPPRGGISVAPRTGERWSARSPHAKSPPVGRKLVHWRTQMATDFARQDYAHWKDGSPRPSRIRQRGSRPTPFCGWRWVRWQFYPRCR